MLKRTLSLVVLSLLFMSCNQNGASKITDEDMKIVEEEKALIGKFPKVELDKLTHDFGTINEGDVVETEFIVKNTGETDLVIMDAKGSCGCTVPQPPKEPIKPGDSAPIKVSFNSSGKPGQQSKTVTLTTNTEAGKETFEIKANVTPKAK
jgi:hypothetical protein